MTAEEALKHEWLSKDLKHGFSLPVIKVEKNSGSTYPNEITPRRIIRPSQTHKKLLVPSESPIKLLSSHLLN
jgi:hypothetical protein